MTKFWIISLIDWVFISISVFLIVFAWINFYVRNLWATFWISLLFSFAILFLIYWFLSKKQEKTKINKKQTAEINKCFLAFRLSSKSEQINLLKKIIAKEHEVDKTIKNLIYQDDFGKHKVIIATNIKKLNNDDLINILNENFDNSCDCYDIFCNEWEILNTEILKNKKIFLIDSKKLYFDYFLKHNIFPKFDNLNLETKKLKFKEIAFNMFNQSKARTYFLCGLVLVFSSLILPHHYYYIIFGSMLLLFAIICKILPKIKN